MQHSIKVRRRFNTFMVLAAATTGLAVTQLSLAAPTNDTWEPINGSGNWSDGTKWMGGAAPVSGATTDLFFPASGVQSYSANNDVANPFTLNSLNMLNAGSGNVAVIGGALTGGIATGGAFVRTNNTGAGTSQINNGGTVYSLRVAQGLMEVNGGNWTLTSTQRQNDVIAGIDDGFWGLNVGDTANLTSRFRQSGGTMTADGFGYIAVANNTTSFATFTGNATVANFTSATNGRIGVGVGSGTIAIENGAVVNTRLLEGARQDTTSVMNMFIDGANSKLNISLQLLANRGANSVGSITVTNNAQLNVTAGNSFIGSVTTPTLDPVFNRSWVTVGSGGQFNVPSDLANQGQQTIGTGGEGTVIFNAGGSGNAKNTFIGRGGDATSGVGTMQLNGGTFTNRAQLNISSGLAPSRLDINNGTFIMNGVAGGTFVNAFTCTNAGDQAIINVSGGTAAFVQSGARTFLLAGGGTVGGGATRTTAINVTNGGLMQIASGPASGLLDIGAVGNINATLTVNGSGSRVTVGNSSGSGDFVISDDVGANARATFSGAGTGSVGRSMFVSTTDGGSGTATIDGPGSSMDVKRALVIAGGGADTLGDPLPAGRGQVDITNGGLMIAQNAFVASTPTGATPGSGAFLNISGANSVMNVTDAAGTSEFDMSLDPASVSQAMITAGGRLSVNGNSFLSPEVGGVSTATVSDGTFQVNNELQMGTNGGSLGGNSQVTVNTNGFIGVGTASNVGALIVGQTSTLTIGTGTSRGTVRVQGDTGIDGFVAYNSGTFNTTGTLEVAGTVRLSDAARVAGTPTNKKTVEAGRMVFTASGVVDLNDNDAIFKNNTRAEIEAFVITGRAGGAWTGNALTSTAAKNNAAKTTGLGVVRGSEYTSTGTTSFNGRPVAASDVLVKYTWNGDADLNGKVDGADYAKIDTAFNNNTLNGGWFNGDFDYSGDVDGADYAAIDTAFNSQGSTVLGRPGIDAGLAGPSDDRQIISTGMDGARAHRGGDTQFTMRDRSIVNQLAERIDNDGNIGGIGATQAVPEPSVLGIVGVCGLGALSRRRRSK